MEQQSLYVISHLGRDRFVWAASAAEARATIALPRPSIPSETRYQRAIALASPGAAAGERHARRESAR